MYLSSNIWLVATDEQGNLSNQRYTVGKKGATIGKAQTATFQLPYEEISDFHVQITFEQIYEQDGLQNIFLVQSKGSEPTYLNNELIGANGYRLHEGDVITLSSVISFTVQSTDDENQKRIDSILETVEISEYYQGMLRLKSRYLLNEGKMDIVLNGGKTIKKAPCKLYLLDDLFLWAKEATKRKGCFKFHGSFTMKVIKVTDTDEYPFGITLSNRITDESITLCATNSEAKKLWLQEIKRVVDEWRKDNVQELASGPSRTIVLELGAAMDETGGGLALSEKERKNREKMKKKAIEREQKEKEKRELKEKKEAEKKSKRETKSAAKMQEITQQSSPPATMSYKRTSSGPGTLDTMLAANLDIHGELKRKQLDMQARVKNSSVGMPPTTSGPRYHSSGEIPNPIKHAQYPLAKSSSFGPSYSSEKTEYGAMPPRQNTTGSAPMRPPSNTTSNIPQPIVPTGNSYHANPPARPAQPAQPSVVPQQYSPTVSNHQQQPVSHVKQGINGPARSFNPPAPPSQRKLIGNAPQVQPEQTPRSNMPSYAAPTPPSSNIRAPQAQQPQVQSQVQPHGQPQFQGQPQGQQRQLQQPMVKKTFTPSAVKATLIPQRAPRVKAALLTTKQSVAPPVKRVEQPVAVHAPVATPVPVKAVAPPPDNIIPPPPIPVDNSMNGGNGDEEPLSIDLTGALKATVVNDYFPIDSEDLPLVQGDVVYVLERDPSGWWKGVCNNKVGLFPENFVRLEGQSQSAQQSPKTVASHQTGQAFDYSTLTKLESIPQGADLDYLEKHLPDQEFYDTFRMTREDFYKLPLWKRNHLKRQKNLYQNTLRPNQFNKQ